MIAIIHSVLTEKNRYFKLRDRRSLTVDTESKSVDVTFQTNKRAAKFYLTLQRKTGANN